MRPTLLSVFIGCALAMSAREAAAHQSFTLDEALALAKAVKVSEPEHRNAARAFAALKPFADAGEAQACAEIGYLSFLGYGLSSEQRALALQYMRCAADAGNPSAAFWVAGEMHGKRSADAANLERQYLQLAVAGGHSGAQVLLAELEPAPHVLLAAQKGLVAAAIPTVLSSVAVEVVPRTVDVAQAAHSPIHVDDIQIVPAQIERSMPASIEVVGVEIARAMITVDPMVVASIGQEIQAPSFPNIDSSRVVPDQDPAQDHDGNASLHAGVPEAPTNGAMAIPSLIASASAATVDAYTNSAPANESDRVIELEAKIRRMEEEANRRAIVERAEQLNRQGLDYLTQHRPAEAALAFREANSLGNMSATTNLGLMYLTGDGVKADPNQAARLLEQSANSGNAIAAENLARMYEFAIGVPRDTQQAIHWYERASLMGSTRGASALLRLKKGGS